MSSSIIRHAQNPVLTAEDVPYPSTLVFNPGVIKHNNLYYMLFRNDYLLSPGNRTVFGTNLGLAYSKDGIKWEVDKSPRVIKTDEKILRTYDPRLHIIDGEIYVCFAADTRHGIRGGIAKTKDFVDFEILSMSIPDNRNMVLFPEKINGNYARLERPFTVYSRGGKDRFDIWYSESPDLKFWGNSELVLGVEDVPYTNDKIGPAAPPIKTSKGWLTTIHGVYLDKTRGKNGWEDRWQKIYYAGIMLLDLHNPSKVLGIYKEPLLSPETPLERNGFRNDVIFPCGMILEPDNSVKIYYGAADTVVCLLTANLDELVDLCLKDK